MRVFRFTLGMIFLLLALWCGSRFTIKRILDREINASTQAMERLPESAGLLAERASYLLYRGRLYGRTSDLNRALRDINEAIELQSDEPLLYNMRGLICLSRKVDCDWQKDFKKVCADLSHVGASPFAGALGRHCLALSHFCRRAGKLIFLLAERRGFRLDVRGTCVKAHLGARERGFTG